MEPNKPKTTHNQPPSTKIATFTMIISMYKKIPRFRPDPDYWGT